MHKNKVAGRIVNLLLVIWFLCMPFFWHFDLAAGYADSSYSYFDSFLMAPYAAIHLVVFFALVFVSVYLNGFSLWQILLIGLYFPFVQLVNFPYFTIRDVFLHGAPAQEIVANGRLVNPSTIPFPSALSTPSLQATWPGTYFLQGILMSVTGLGVIISNDILYFCLMIVVLLVIYSFSLLLKKKNFSLGWTGALLFLPLFFNYAFDNFHLYSDTAFAFTLYFMFLLVFMRFESRHGLVLSSVLVGAIIISHPFQSLAVISFLCIYVILMGRNRLSAGLLALFSIITFLAWVFFQSPQGVELFLVSSLKLFSAGNTSSVSVSLSPPQALPWWGALLTNYFKYSLVALLVIAFLAGAFVFFKLRIRTKISVGLTSILLSSIVMLFILILLPDWNISRFTSFAAFPAAFSLVLLAEIRRNAKIKKFTSFLGKHFILFTLLLFIVTFSAASMALRFEINHYYGELYHPSEMASYSFFFNNNNNATLFVVSWRTYIYSGYFNYNYSHQVSMIWVSDLVALSGNLSGLQSDYGQQINQSQFVLRGMRDTLTIEAAQANATTLANIDQKYLIPAFNQVYSNGNYTLYARAGT